MQISYFAMVRTKPQVNKQYVRLRRSADDTVERNEETDRESAPGPSGVDAGTSGGLRTSPRKRTTPSSQPTASQRSSNRSTIFNSQSYEY